MIECLANVQIVRLVSFLDVSQMSSPIKGTDGGKGVCQTIPSTTSFARGFACQCNAFLSLDFLAPEIESQLDLLLYYTTSTSACTIIT
jgi:hypothetical protein